MEVLREDEVHRVYFPKPEFVLQLESIEHFQVHAKDTITSVDRDDPDMKAPLS